MRVLENSANTPVFDTLRRWAIQETPESGYCVDGYQVAAQPDLFDFLKKLVVHVPNAQHQYLFGIPILHSPNGVIFATARGTDTLCLRLPKVTDWGRTYGDYGGEPWRQGSAWSTYLPQQEHDRRLATLVRIAYDSANALNE